MQDFSKFLESYEIPLDVRENAMKNAAKFERFCAELLRWNATHNLTNYRKSEQIYENILDSILPLGFIKKFENALDIGSGNGFPAIPLAIMCEDSHFYLVEPNAKKASFLSVVSLNLGLKNTTILKSKIQNIEQKISLDLISSRAFANSEELISLSERFLRDNGAFLFYKGSSENIDNIKKISKKYDKMRDLQTKIFQNRVYLYIQKGV